MVIDKEEHKLLRLLVFFMFMFSLMVMAKVVVDNSSECDFVLSSYMLNTTTNVTHNTYTYECEAVTTNTHNILFKMATYFMVFFITYLFIYYMYVGFIRAKLVDVGIINRKKNSMFKRFR